MKNILHRHKYKIIGTCDNRDIFDGKINGLDLADSIKPILSANGKPIKDDKGLIEFSR